MERDFLKCKDREWKEKKSKVCGKDGSDGKIKLTDCTPEQKKVLLDAFSLARTKLGPLKSKLSSALGEKHGSKTLGKLKKAEKIVSRISSRLNSRVNLVCGTNAAGCKSTPNAHSSSWPLDSKAEFCPGFFSKSEIGQAGILVHEISHIFGTDDAKDFGASSPPVDSKNKAWEDNAETYEYWVEHGFCVPEVDCG